jgi:hypothetical protein
MPLTENPLGNGISDGTGYGERRELPEVAVSGAAGSASLAGWEGGVANLLSFEGGGGGGGGKDDGGSECKLGGEYVLAGVVVAAPYVRGRFLG